jgi:hypothetical protein
MESVQEGCEEGRGGEGRGCSAGRPTCAPPCPVTSQLRSAHLPCCSAAPGTPARPLFALQIAKHFGKFAKPTAQRPVTKPTVATGATSAAAGTAAANSRIPKPAFAAIHEKLFKKQVCELAWW